MKIDSKTAILLCNGEAPTKGQFTDSLHSADLFIAADGGAFTAQDFGLTPDVIIGDMDSFTDIAQAPCPVIKDPDQDTNDLEKALAYALEQGMVAAVVFGATGKRVDHTVKNLSVLKRFYSRFKSLVFRDKYSDIKLLSSPHTEPLPTGTSVSLFPLSGTVTGVTSSGLQFPLQNDTLQNGVFDGTSNKTTQPEITISFKTGDLLFFINHNKG